MYKSDFEKSLKNLQLIEKWQHSGVFALRWRAILLLLVPFAVLAALTLLHLPSLRLQIQQKFLETLS